MPAVMTTQQRVMQSTVRTILSLGGHVGAVFAIYSEATGGGGESAFKVPDWLPAIFALVITWYFATKESKEEDELPEWQVTLRGIVRGVHAIGGGIALAILLISGIPIPQWWVAIYLSILTFYFIELRDPPKAIATGTSGKS